MENKYHYPLPRDEVKSIQQAIQKIRFEKQENLYIFKNGKQILRFKGDKNQVNIPVEYLFQLSDSEVVHNHPSNTSFSFEDIEMAIFHNISKLTASTPDFIFEVYRPGDTWGFSLEDDNIAKLFNVCQAFARAELEKLRAQNQITRTELELKFFHYIWVLFFNSFDIQYVQTKHPK